MCCNLYINENFSFVSPDISLTHILSLSLVLLSVQQLHCCHSEQLLHYKCAPKLAGGFCCSHLQITYKSTAVPLAWTVTDISRPKVKYGWHFSSMMNEFWQEMSGGLETLADPEEDRSSLFSNLFFMLFQLRSLRDRMEGAKITHLSTHNRQTEEMVNLRDRQKDRQGYRWT